MKFKVGGIFSPATVRLAGCDRPSTGIDRHLNTAAQPITPATPSRIPMGRPIPTTKSDLWVATSVLSVVGLAALALFYWRNEILLSGDAVAHINIARRVFDSRTPSPMQLGTVWLPLPHVLTIPFVISTRMWQSGIGGS